MSARITPPWVNATTVAASRLGQAARGPLDAGGEIRERLPPGKPKSGLNVRPILGEQPGTRSPPPRR